MADAVARGMRRIVASVALFCSLNVVTSCVLPPPTHGIALAIDATAIVAGTAMALTNEHGPEDSGLRTEDVGGLMIASGLAAGVLTLLIYGLDEPVSKTNEKPVKGSAAWLLPAPASEPGDINEQPKGAADSYAARDALLHPFKR
jgi:hypothetical protein